MSIDNTHITVVSMPNRASGSDAWVAWHEQLKKYLGKKQANIIWLKAWQRRKGQNASSNALRQYMKKQDVEIDKSTLESLSDFKSNALDYIGDFYTAGKFLTIALGVIVVGGTGMIIYNLAKDPNKTIDIASKAMLKK